MEFVLSLETKNWAKIYETIVSIPQTSDKEGSTLEKEKTKRGAPSLISGGGFQTTMQEWESRWSPVVSLRMQLGGPGGCSSQGREVTEERAVQKGEED